VVEEEFDRAGEFCGAAAIVGGEHPQRLCERETP
jgi:hypothetical protein